MGEEGKGTPSLFIFKCGVYINTREEPLASQNKYDDVCESFFVMETSYTIQCHWHRGSNLMWLRLRFKVEVGVEVEAITTAH